MAAVLEPGLPKGSFGWEAQREQEAETKLSDPLPVLGRLNLSGCNIASREAAISGAAAGAVRHSCKDAHAVRFPA